MNVTTTSAPLKGVSDVGDVASSVQVDLPLAQKFEALVANNRMVAPKVGHSRRQGEQGEDAASSPQEFDPSLLASGRYLKV